MCEYITPSSLPAPPGPPASPSLFVLPFCVVYRSRVIVKLAKQRRRSRRIPPLIRGLIANATSIKSPKAAVRTVLTVARSGCAKRPRVQDRNWSLVAKHERSSARRRTQSDAQCGLKREKMTKAIANQSLRIIDRTCVKIVYLARNAFFRRHCHSAARLDAGIRTNFCGSAIDFEDPRATVT